MTSPNPWLFSGPDVIDSAVPPFLAALPPPLGPLIAGAWGLFGSHPHSSTLPPDGGTPHDPAAGPQGQPGTFVGPTAEAEAAAKQTLSGQTATLKDLDQQLDDLSTKITAQNDAARQKLLDIKSDIEKELDYANTSTDDDIQKSAALSQFLGDKTAAIAKVITDAAASVSANQEQIRHLNSQYGQNPDPSQPATQNPDPTDDPSGPTDPVTSPAAAPSAYGPGAGDPYGGGGGGEGYGADPASELGQMLPQMASALPGALGGMNPMSSLGGLGDLGSVLGDAIHSGNGHNDDGGPHPADKSDKSDDKGGNKKSDQHPQKNDQSGQTTSQISGQDPQNGQQQPGAAPAATPPPPPPAPSLVKRPDGSSAMAVSPAVASAASAHLGGASIEDAYKAAGITLPPPGTQIKDTLPSLSMAQVGDLAVFKDKYVMLLGDNKIYLDGQEQPVSALAKLTGFMAFCHPPASSTPSVPAPASPPAAPSAPAPSTSV